MSERRGLVPSCKRFPIMGYGRGPGGSVRVLLELRLEAWVKMMKMRKDPERKEVRRRSEE